MRKLRTFPDSVPKGQIETKPSNSSPADAAIHTGHGPGDKPGRPNRAQHRPLQHDIPEPAPRARRRRTRREAGAKRERGLTLIAGQTRNALRPLGPSRGLAFAVDHLDRLIERLHGEPTRGRAQMLPARHARRRASHCDRSSRWMRPVIRHLTRQLATHYHCRNKALVGCTWRRAIRESKA